MYIGLDTLALWFLIGFGLWYWWRAKAINEVALAAARDACERIDVVLLDQSVYLRGLGFGRDDHGRLHIRRTFHFDFTATGESRYRGQIILLGMRTEQVSFQPHRF
ncbi:DUF3301 domain-containing protein [Marinobacteraceae bacterium S3BR75-40.1]